MSTHCPKDSRPCIDDLCRGSGNCIMTNTSMLERCPFVGAVLSVFIVVGVLTVFGLACFGGYALWLLAFGR